MKFHVVTLFPEVVGAYTNASILGRAQKNKLMSVKAYQLRDFVTPAKAGARGASEWFYKKVDDKAYGGGPGMVLQAEPFVRAADKIRKGKKIKVLITSAGGKAFTNEYAKKLAKEKEVIILCGRYEGIDARVKKVLNAEEVSVGPYILTGGELPALTIIDSTARQIKGVLGKFESLEEERVASHDVYTRPEVFTHKKKTYRVPKVLLSGHHANIDTQRTKRRSGKSA
ncbi:tRNA (guanosine(37)-N1)-methyltransferase TrmD [Candidatus Adlerbacteria bacterium RIFOXYC1_FULL_48_26]|uniref:tRNA (guanine-N(1)-)-methyltransferase n=1 Tax=Candidatus Adlerbacteria bacterium RIFOXYC1_FULL_48_26 TaxID=1797247 RepID=A0A1F4Y4E6_9BACT|nr:MAG: tRNA (guanosine(37)-N1)-methyltransferase TrmD [Candidatus Adlerbacteria bacterium RIFOXYC1_FULL_48_26]OGC94610.1 MAG: tRNA (guanosine(37)-N1)-methyltransferase TrmD [Candidatus Adlerbacteria bacterium RIFOXYB1_FULL_48_10]